MKKKPPKFKSEDQERDFWATEDSTDYIDWDSARRIILPGPKPSQKAISLHLPAMMLAELKRLANKRDVPYPGHPAGYANVRQREARKR